MTMIVPLPDDLQVLLRTVQTGTQALAGPLSADELRVAGLLVTGALNPAIAHELGMSEEDVRRHLDRIGQETGARTRHTRANCVLAAGLVPPPPVTGPAPTLSAPERLLLVGLATCETWERTAVVANLDLRTVKPATQSLLRRVGAAHRTHLVGLAYGWKLIGASTAALGHDSAGS
ncbi:MULTISPECIES: helix-turn-helix domain-containing protein [Streptomyces]|uniref:HTH luxR-type domain-containing protein n=1 Tax=Streptomyces xanthochromogenes TaxID=67384 RepID=A0ABQ2ZDQ4_9ACTN|nr:MULTISPECIES: hypothetical protein [Streptomyces]MYV93043.1 hypothetical protein [Streptomyces sp. SID1034]GGY13619.1 hypothetical protein GCM10010326_01130 [Streptomyces xanthochromogenes]